MPVLRNPYLLLVTTALIWSGNAIAGKFAIGHISPMMLTLFRWGIALTIIAVIARQELREDWPTIRKNWPYLLLMGGFGYAVFNYCLYSALQYTSAINVTLEQSAMPLIIFILNYLLYKTRITWLQIIGYFFTILGVLFTVSAGDPWGFVMSRGEGLNKGDWFMLAAALCYGGYSVALRSKPQMHWQSFLAMLIAAAAIFSVVGAGLEYQAGNSMFPVTMQGFLVAIYAGVFPSLVAQGFFIKGVEALGANAAGLFINLVPVFGAILAVLLLGEQFHLYHAIAFIFVVGGILIAQRSRA